VIAADLNAFAYCGINPASRFSGRSELPSKDFLPIPAFLGQGCGRALGDEAIHGRIFVVIEGENRMAVGHLLNFHQRVLIFCSGWIIRQHGSSAFAYVCRSKSRRWDDPSRMDGAFTAYGQGKHLADKEECRWGHLGHSRTRQGLRRQACFPRYLHDFRCGRWHCCCRRDRRRGLPPPLPPPIALTGMTVPSRMIAQTPIVASFLMLLSAGVVSGPPDPAD
jgi:hypothetical protein